jgi:hypothetical protein
MKGRSIVVTLVVALAASAPLLAQTKTPSTSTPPKTAPFAITLTTQPAALKTGENQFTVTVKLAGKPFDDADVAVTFVMPAMPSMKMAEMRNVIPLKHQSAGVYRGSGQVMMAGKWDVTVTVKQAGKETGSKKLKLTAK